MSGLSWNLKRGFWRRASVSPKERLLYCSKCGEIDPEVGFIRIDSEAVNMYSWGHHNKNTNEKCWGGEYLDATPYQRLVKKVLG